MAPVLRSPTEPYNGQVLSPRLKRDVQRRPNARQAVQWIDALGNVTETALTP